MTPYASVIVPIIDRAATLEVALEMACAQSCRDIEILVSCCGSSDEVKHVAERFERSDGRVRVIDTPPIPRFNVASRHNGVERARSERIFVLQDDDLWMPDHVTTLGSLLDAHDLVAETAAAGTRAGHVVAWPNPYCHPDYRRVCRETGLKSTFEAHLAFRRDAYYKYDIAWNRVLSGGATRHLLDCFVEEGTTTRIATLPIATAISLNSPIRQRMTNEERAQETRAWCKRVAAAGGIQALMAKASYAPALENLLVVHLPSPEDNLTTYLAGVGLHIKGSSSSVDTVELELTDRQLRHLEATLDVSLGRQAPASVIIDMAADMMEPFAGPNPRKRFVMRMLVAAYGREAILGFLEQALERETNELRQALLFLALASLSFHKGEFDRADRLWRKALSRDPELIYVEDVFAAQIAARTNRNDDAIKILSRDIAAGVRRA
jgi:tetratricopeptide (TPR) repeat protein